MITGPPTPPEPFAQARGGQEPTGACRPAGTDVYPAGTCVTAVYPSLRPAGDPGRVITVGTGPASPRGRQPSGHDPVGSNLYRARRTLPPGSQALRSAAVFAAIPPARAFRPRPAPRGLDGC